MKIGVKGFRNLTTFSAKKIKVLFKIGDQYLIEF